ncbi:hypothetical protein PANT111_200011 [Pantoea brenneri]|uniref:ABC transporter permease n=1 Tax=Pantoea brenneri TaxID=472694 RepID=A0AAX3J760_9GAMM|nr:hypothetical protein PANT111_200011 [Pantoea brenneri]
MNMAIMQVAPQFIRAFLREWRVFRLINHGIVFPFLMLCQLCWLLLNGVARRQAGIR